MEVVENGKEVQSRHHRRHRHGGSALRHQIKFPMATGRKVEEQTLIYRGKENVKAVKLTCQGNPAYLTEIQISIKADAINAPLSANSFLPQPHPGNCGKTFVIDKAGY